MFIRRCAAPPFFKDKAVDANGEVAANWIRHFAANTNVRRMQAPGFNIFCFSPVLNISDDEHQPFATRCTL